MKKKKQSYLKSTLIIAVLLSFSLEVIGQTNIPEILNESPLKEQMNYIEERTRIYENYRAIREDMFQKIKTNAIDSLSEAKSVIIGLNISSDRLKRDIDSLNTALETTKNKLFDVTVTKNSISVFGLEINKSIYNFVMWIIIAALVFILALGFLVFKRTMAITFNTKKELVQLKEEFEAYRQTAREAREKMSMAHFNELKKLRGG